MISAIFLKKERNWYHVNSNYIQSISCYFLCHRTNSKSCIRRASVGCQLVMLFWRKLDLSREKIKIWLLRIHRSPAAFPKFSRWNFTASLRTNEKQQPFAYKQTTEICKLNKTAANVARCMEGLQFFSALTMNNRRTKPVNISTLSCDKCRIMKF